MMHYVGAYKALAVVYGAMKHLYCCIKTTVELGYQDPVPIETINQNLGFIPIWQCCN